MPNAAPMITSIRLDPSHIDIERRILRNVVISTASMDREGDIIEGAGLDWSNFQKNPVLIWNHDLDGGRSPGHLPVIGRVLRIEAGGRETRADIQFADTDFARQIFHLYAEGYMKAFSIGILPTRAEPLDPGDGAPPGALRVLAAEVYELSACPVGCNPDALAKNILSAIPVKGGASMHRAMMKNVADQLAESRQEMEEVNENLEQLREEFENARVKDDAAEMERISEALRRLERAMEEGAARIRELVERYNELKSGQDALEAADGILKGTDTRHKSAPAGRPAALPRDGEADERGRRKSFYAVMKQVLAGGQGAFVRHATEADYNALRPKNQKLQNGANAGASPSENILIPQSMWAAVNGFAKSIEPMLSTDGAAAGGRGYAFYPQADRTLGVEETPLPALFDAVTRRPISGGAWIGPKADQTDEDDFAGVQVFRFEEGTELPGTEMRIKQDRIDAYPLGAISAFSKQLLQRDQAAFEAEFMTMLREAWAWRLNREIMTGTGTQECLGILNDPAVESVARQNAGQAAYEDLVNLKHSLRPRFRRNASWFMSDTAEAYLEKQEDDAKRPLFAPTVASGPYNGLLNYPYAIDESMPPLAGKGSILLGDLRKYWLVIEEEGVIATSEHALFTQGLVAVRIMGLAGGRLRWKRGVKLLAGAESGAA